MKQYLRAIGICIAIAIFGFSFKSLFAGEHSSKQFLKHLCQEERLASEPVALDSLEHLYFDQEHITLNVEGVFYNVHSLQKNGNHWEVTLSGRQYGYCQKGHDLCKCGTCHKPGCYFYIRPCSLWDK